MDFTRQEDHAGFEPAVGEGPNEHSVRTPISRLGFFHSGGLDKSDPIGSLLVEIEKRQKSELEDTLLVLPEAFNALGGYYSAEPALDPHSGRRLQAISEERGIVFLAALVEKIKGPMSAYLLDARDTPQRLTSKRTNGWECLYAGSETKEDRIIPYRGVGIGALICDDAANTYGDALQAVVDRINALKMGHSVLCIPSCMTTTDSVGTATRWGTSITVVLANGSNSQPSVLVHASRHLRSEHRYPPENEIQCCDLNPPARKEP